MACFWFPVNELTDSGIGVTLNQSIMKACSCGNIFNKIRGVIRDISDHNSHYRCSSQDKIKNKKMYMHNCKCKSCEFIHNEWKVTV